MKTIKNLFIILLLSLSFTTKSKLIIFDVEGVLLKVSPFKMVQEMDFLSTGMMIIPFFKILWSSPFDLLKMKEIIQETLFDFLNFAYEKNPEEALTYKEPAILHQRYRGKLSNQETLDIVRKKIDQYNFKNSFEKKITEKTVDCMLDGKKFGQTFIMLDKKVLKILKTLKNAKKIDGSAKHKLAILSNIDSESFPVIYKHNMELFENFELENIFLSYNLGMSIPDPKIFQKVLENTKTKPEDTIFIDDKQENCQAAESVGISSIHFQIGKDSLEKLAKNLGISENTHKEKQIL